MPYRALFLALAAALIAVGSEHASADVITLSNGGATALFHTEDDDPAPPGLYQWTVDGTDHLAQQWFWYRVGNAGGEAGLDTLNQTSISTSNVDGEAGDDFLLVRYQNAAQTFEISVSYLLAGATAASHLEEVVTVRNLTNAPLDFHLFQYVNFDLAGTPGGDNVVMSGAPINTAVQTDGAFQVAETVVTPPPSHYEVNQFGGANSLEGRLADASATTLLDLSGPLANVDATWGFQWDAVIAAGGSFQVSKTKSLTEAIPEPSTIVLAGLAGFGLLAQRVVRRLRRPS